MSKTDYAKCSNFFVLVFLIMLIHFCASAPINGTENAYTQFIAELNRNKCSIPTQVQLPFDTTKVNNFEYLSSYLEICQKTESTKRNKEAVVLCKEIFDNIRNISCPIKIALPDIAVNLSKNVCQDIGARKNMVPEDDKSLLKRLTDSFLCDIMCDSEFEKACQVLLWSFQVQELIAKVASTQEPEQPIVPEEGGDLNVDSVQQDIAVDETGLPQMNVNPKKEKTIAEGAKDVIEVVGHDGISEEPEPRKLEDNPKQNFDIQVVSGEKGKKEKPLSNNAEPVSENQAISKTKSQDSTGSSKSTSDLNRPTTFTKQMPVVETSNSDTEDKEMAKIESNDQNVNKQLQVSKAIQDEDEANAVGGLSHGSNNNVATDEQTQVNANALADGGVQNEKDASILVQDNSHVPASQNILLNDENNVTRNELSDETLRKVDQNSDFFNNNYLPHESDDAKQPNNALMDLHNDEGNPTNLVDTVAQNTIQSTATNDDKLTKIADITTTNSQTIKDITQHQTVHETTQDKTSIAEDGTKVDQSQIDSISRKVENQNHTKMDTLTHDPITDDKIRNPSTDQKKLKIAKQTEELDNTIKDTSETSITADEKSPENSQKPKTAATNPHDKSVIPSSLTETSSKTTVALEKMEEGNDFHQPADGGAEPYGDPENAEEDEYTRPEYDIDSYDVAKNKDSNPDVSIPNIAAKEKTNQNEKQMESSSRNEFGQDLSSFQFSSFPEQEDSHFFFYFLSIVLILMAGYLIFHNKQKIIALIVEGRHERNRRSHRVGYKKLETK